MATGWPVVAVPTVMSAARRAGAAVDDAGARLPFPPLVDAPPCRLVAGRGVDVARQRRRQRAADDAASRSRGERGAQRERTGDQRQRVRRIWVTGCVPLNR